MQNVNMIEANDVIPEATFRVLSQSLDINKIKKMGKWPKSIRTVG